MCPNPKWNRPNILAARSVKNCLNLDELYKFAFCGICQNPLPVGVIFVDGEGHILNMLHWLILYSDNVIKNIGPDRLIHSTALQ